MATPVTSDVSLPPEGEIPSEKPLSPLEQASKNVFVQTVVSRVKTGVTTALMALGMAISSSAMATDSPYEKTASTPTISLNVEVVKNDLFTAFNKFNKPEKRQLFESLSEEQQTKVLKYYQLGKGEQPNEKELIKGVFALMKLHDTSNLVTKAIIEINSGRVPSETPEDLEPIVPSITKAFPSAKDFIKIEAIRKADADAKDAYIRINKQLTQKSAQLKQESAQLKQQNKALLLLLQAL